MEKHNPTEEQRRIVAEMTAFGIPQKSICKVVGISDKTLSKHYREEIENSAAQMTHKVAGQLFKKCMDGDTTSIIFWLKTRAGWKETVVNENVEIEPTTIKIEKDT